MTDSEIVFQAMRDEVRRKGLYEAVARRVDRISETLEGMSETRQKAAYSALSEILLLVTAANREKE